MPTEMTRLIRSVVNIHGELHLDATRTEGLLKYITALEMFQIKATAEIEKLKELLKEDL